ncbi:hypothetical protein [Isoptericola sp. BMS4]|uniref:hypothetical protein n=1 Tax=Isoptericola sp. BMS4 TaxID=2527875 RepID=UPI00142481D5|nr:hypothetical protein [Isoptericola sp. BMS4]
MISSAPTNADNPARWRLRTQIPDDWIDLAGTTSPSEAVGVVTSALEDVGIEVTKHEQRLLRSGLEAWHRFSRDNGLLVHGLVYQGREYSGQSAIGSEVFWTVTGFVTDISAFEGALSPMEALRRVVAAKLGVAVDEAYTELFHTGIGPAIGMTVNHELMLQQPGVDDQPPVTSTVGLALVVAMPPEGGPSLVLGGLSRDPTQRDGLGMLLARIAGPATIVPADRETPAEGER